MMQVDNKENSTSKLLDLPLEIREVVYSEIFGSHKVFYLRSKGVSRGIPSPLAHGVTMTWHNEFEWRNPCPQLLLVNKQVRRETLEAILHHGVLDIWGTMRLHDRTTIPKTLGDHVKNIAVSSGRVTDLVGILPQLQRIERIFVDSLHVPSKIFATHYDQLVGSLTASRASSPNTPARRSASQHSSPRRRSTSGCDNERVVWDRIVAHCKRSGSNSEDEPQVLELIHNLFCPPGNANAICLFVRCVTFEEETVIRLQHGQPAQIHHGVVNRFEHKFRSSHSSTN